METDWNAEIGGGCDDDDDDIARFEAQCAARARAEGIGDGGEDGSDEEDVPSRRARLVQSTGAPPQDAGEWRLKCELLQEKLGKREGELAQARGDIDLIRNDGTGAGDISSEIKQRLLELTKKNRRMQVSIETQKSRIQQLETEAKKPRAEARALAEELAAQATNAIVGDGVEDWKKKYLQASNKLQEVRQEVQEVRAQSHRQKKVLLKELGSDEALEKALSTADDPEAKGWKGRAAQVSQLQRQVREMKEQLKRSVPKDDAAEQSLQADGADVSEKTRRRGVVDKATEKDKSAVGHAAEKRREEFERLQEEVEKLRGDQADAKRKRDALKSRAGVLESQLREMKAHVQVLLSKSDNDDQLVAALQRQQGRETHPPPEGSSFLKKTSRAGSPTDPDDLAELRQMNAELQEQVDRQAQIVLQLRQKNLASALENGSAKLGPESVEDHGRIIERARYLEAENAKLLEQVRLLHHQLGEGDGFGPPGGRPFSAGSTLNLQEKLRGLSEKMVLLERENHALRQRALPYEDEDPGDMGLPDDGDSGDSDQGGASF